MARWCGSAVEDPPKNQEVSGLIRGVDRGQGMELAGSLLGDIQEAASQCFSHLCFCVSIRLLSSLSKI